MNWLLFAGLVLAASLLGGHFWLLFALGWLGSKLLGKIWGWNMGANHERAVTEQTDAPAMAAVEVSTTPDVPVPFGYKISWAAIRCDAPERVIAALRPSLRQPANWTSGVARAYGRSGEVFVSPPLEGFLLVVGFIDDGRTADLAGAFSEVQFFASHRVSGYYQWEKYLHGQRVRRYCCEDCVLETDEGTLTPEEQKLGFVRFSPDGSAWPDEEDVLAIAAAWGIDPKFEHKTYPPDTGWLCALYGAEKGVM